MISYHLLVGVFVLVGAPPKEGVRDGFVYRNFLISRSSILSLRRWPRVTGMATHKKQPGSGTGIWTICKGTVRLPLLFVNRGLFLFSKRSLLSYRLVSRGFHSRFIMLE